MTPTVQYKTHSGNTYPARQTHMITSELGRLLHATGCDWTHLYKGCISKLGQSPGNLGLAASCGTYHEDVLGHNLLLQHQATYAKKNQSRSVVQTSDQDITISDRRCWYGSTTQHMQGLSKADMSCRSQNRYQTQQRVIHAVTQVRNHCAYPSS